MSGKRITAEEHKRQIDAYTAERPNYEIFAQALERVLKQACAVSIAVCLRKLTAS